MRLSGIMIGSENPSVLGDFYAKIFGEAGWHDKDWYGFDIGGGGLMIGSHSEVKGKNASAARIIIVIECDDVKQEFEKFKAAGAEVVAEPYQPSSDKAPDTWLATVADPDGNYLQLSNPWKM